MIKAVKRSISLVMILCLLVPVFSGLVLPVKAQEREATGQQRSSWTYNFYYRHYYDAASFDAGNRGYIDEAVAFANNVYSACMGPERLNVTLQTTGTVSQDLYSGLSGCRAGVDTPCRTSAGCGSNGSHHKDIGRISNQLYNAYTLLEDTPNTFWVLWCNQDEGTWCEYDSYTGMHSEAYGYAVVVDNRPVIQIMTLPSNAFNVEAHMAILLAHETAHSMGYVDVYDTPNHMDDGTTNCIMDYFLVRSSSSGEVEEDTHDFYEAITEDSDNYATAFCENCRGGIAIQINERFECLED